VNAPGGGYDPGRAGRSVPTVGKHPPGHAPVAGAGRPRPRPVGGAAGSPAARWAERPFQPRKPVPIREAAPVRTGLDTPPSAFRPRRAHLARRIRDLLRTAVLSGDFGSGPLPGEAELATQYGTGRNVIRAALDLLRQEGLVARIQGSGTFCQTRKSYHRFGSLHSLEESLGGGHVAHRLLAYEALPAPPAVASRLGVEVGATCVFLERLGYIDGFPASVSSSWFRGDMVAEIAPRDRTADFYSIINAAGLSRLGDATITLEAIAADASVAELLRLSPGAPILLIDRLLHLADGTPFEWGITHCSSDRFALVMTANRNRSGDSR
jgi:GntR family transcriptional regulator